MPRYNPAEIEPKWQQYWAENDTFRTPEIPAAGGKLYVLDMFLEVGIDVPVDGVAVHHVTSPARGRTWSARAGLSMSMAEMARSSIPLSRSRGTKPASRWR